MSLKPIEPGCLCIVVGDLDYPENIGLQVTVVRAVGKFQLIPEMAAPGVLGVQSALSGWLCAAPGLVWCLGNSPGEKYTGFYPYKASQIMRIDGHEPEQIKREEAVTA